MSPGSRGHSEPRSQHSAPALVIEPDFGIEIEKKKVIEKLKFKLQFDMQDDLIIYIKKFRDRAPWLLPVIPATWEAEAGELLEPRRWRLQ